MSLVLGNLPPATLELEVEFATPGEPIELSVDATLGTDLRLAHAVSFTWPPY